MLGILTLIASCAENLAPQATPRPESEEGDYAEARRQMLKNVQLVFEITDPRVLEAMKTVPRHKFVPERYVSEAYMDWPLPIGEGQTISAPHIVAYMTQLLGLQPGDKVLEIGTGSGYQAAILAEITDEVYTVEIIEVLATRAAETLKELGYDYVKTKLGDGYYGWEEYAPYDAIIVTAAPDHVPQPLINQLKDGGRMVIPVGPPGFYQVQVLWQIEKKGEQIVSTAVCDVQFVPLTGEH